jgi:hypothetical protein
MVLRRIGNTQANAISQIFGMAPKPSREMVSGTSAVVGMARPNWIGGFSARARVGDRPSSTPAETPTITAIQ